MNYKQRINFVFPEIIFSLRTLIIPFKRGIFLYAMNTSINFCTSNSKFFYLSNLLWKKSQDSTKVMKEFMSQLCTYMRLQWCDNAREGYKLSIILLAIICKEAKVLYMFVFYDHNLSYISRIISLFYFIYYASHIRNKS